MPKGTIERSWANTFVKGLALAIVATNTLKWTSHVSGQDISRFLGDNSRVRGGHYSCPVGPATHVPRGTTSARKDTIRVRKGTPLVCWRYFQLLPCVVNPKLNLSNLKAAFCVSITFFKCRFNRTTSKRFSCRSRLALLRLILPTKRGESCPCTGSLCFCCWRCYLRD